MYTNIYNIHAVYKPDTRVSLFITFVKWKVLHIYTCDTYYMLEYCAQLFDSILKLFLFIEWIAYNYTLFQKKCNISEVAFLLEKSVYQWIWGYADFPWPQVTWPWPWAPGKIYGEKLRFFWKRLYMRPYVLCSYMSYFPWGNKFEIWIVESAPKI